MVCMYDFFFFQAEDGIRDYKVTGVQTCALPISLERREPLERDGSPVREADAERGSGARAGGTRGREAPSARRTRLRLSLFARPAVRVAHDVGTRSPSPGDCSVQRRSNPGLPVPSRLRGRFPGHRSYARATCRYLPPTGKGGLE